MKRSKIILISVIVFIIGIVALINYQSIFKSIVPPSPEIVSSQADGSSSTLFEYSMKIKGSVINKGGDGNVVVEATLIQGEDTWTKTVNLYMASYDTQNFEIIFDEAKLLEDPEYTIRTYALGID